MSIWTSRAILTAVANAAHSLIVVISSSARPRRGGKAGTSPDPPLVSGTIQGFSVLTFIPSFARVSPSARPVIVKFSDF
jgi:hypothetical protein